MHAGLLLVAALCLALGAAGPAHAQRRAALLVGVSSYPAASGAKPLRGPANDVVLMRTLLQQHAFRAEDITLLADGVAGAGLPTRANILGTLQRMAQSAKSGDYFFLYFAGHGSQQPAAAGQATRRSEPDGLSETFLPLDIGRWDGARSTVTNAIVNHELDALLDRFLERGAFVWAVFDACHAAALMRGAPRDVEFRHVTPAALGVPPQALERAARAAAKRGEAGAPRVALRERSGAQGFVAFYAAQTNEIAPEMPQPLHLPDGHPAKRPYGVLTFMLAEALATHPRASYRQIAQFILTRYASRRVANRPTPLFTGTHLDAAVFGTVLGPALRQWPISRDGATWTIPAGLLAQVYEGALLAVLPDPAASTERALGFMRVVRSTAFAAELQPEAAPTNNAAAAPDVERFAYARLVRPAPGVALRVAKPTFAPRTPGSAVGLVEAVVRAIQADPALGAGLAWSSAGESADVRLHVESGQLWLLPASGVLTKSGHGATASVALAGATEPLAAAIGDTLQRMARAIGLVRVAEHISADSRAAGVEVILERLRGTASPQLSPADARVASGEQVGFTITNRTGDFVDVTILYVDSRFGITSIFPGRGENNRIEPGAILRAGAGGLDPIEIDDSTTGIEHLLIIATASSARGERFDYSYLAQPRLAATRAAGARDGVASPLEEMLQDAAFGTIATRDGRPPRQERSILKVFTWEVVGAPVAALDRRARKETNAARTR